jgi:hypothetical protein
MKVFLRLKIFSAFLLYIYIYIYNVYFNVFFHFLLAEKGDKKFESFMIYKIYQKKSRACLWNCERSKSLLGDWQHGLYVWRPKKYNNSLKGVPRQVDRPQIYKIQTVLTAQAEDNFIVEREIMFRALYVAMTITKEIFSSDLTNACVC